MNPMLDALDYGASVVATAIGRIRGLWGKNHGLSSVDRECGGDSSGYYHAPTRLYHANATGT